MPGSSVEWIAFDCGARQWSAFAMQGATVCDHVTTGSMTDTVGGPDLEPALLDLVRPLRPTDATITLVGCGVSVPSRGSALLLAPVPAPPPVTMPRQLPMKAEGLQLFVVPGLSQSEPSDFMLGEETVIAGFFALNPGWDGVLCLPGQHTKWVHVSAGEIVSFRTAMTGELIDLIATRSSLREAVGTSGWEPDAFAAGVDQTRSRPEQITTALFGLQADHVLTSAQPDHAGARLWGLLIGAELAATRAFWLGQQVAVIGDTQSNGRYVTALEHQGVAALSADRTRMLVAGLTAAYRSLRNAPDSKVL